MLGLIERVLLVVFIVMVTGYWEGDHASFYSVIALLCAAGYAVTPLIVEFWQTLTKQK